MYYYEVAPNQIVRASAQWFTYASPQELSVGQVVTVPVGKKQLVGIIIRSSSKPDFATKQITSIVDNHVLPEPLVKTTLWISDYYATHLATVLQTVLPRGITKKRRPKPIATKDSVRNRTNFLLNSKQVSAVETFSRMTPGTGILHGVTGSGKTAVYIELTKRALAADRSVIVLTPEIALTSQVVDEFRQHFSNITLTHSRQTEAERHVAWQQVANTTEPQVVIGPRSALFLPVRDLAYIIIDEAHEPSYKQEQSPRYSALRVASILARHWKASVVQGSATPLVSEYYLAKHSQRPIVELPDRAQKAVIPDITIVDMKQKHASTNRYFAKPFLDALSETLQAGHQALIFHNRRGSASTILCESCGWSAVCPRCFIPYTLHADIHKLRCHLCGNTERVPTACPDCQSTDIIFRGIGTKLLETELHRHFPNKNIVRFDGDSSNADSVESRYADLYSGSIDIIVGTQVIAKGLDLPHLRMVGIPQADAGIHLPDFSAEERSFQLLSQAIGRVGRTDHKTNVIVQTFHPGHPAIQFGLSQDYDSLYDYILAQRKRGHFPPFSYILKLTCIYKTESAAIRNARQLAIELKKIYANNIVILGPTPAFYERQRDSYRWQIIVRSPKRQLLVEIMQQHVPATHWQSDIDPLGLI